MRLLHSALNAYLNAPRDDHRWIKLLKAADLDEELRKLDPPIRTNSELRVHQKAGILLGVAHPNFCFFYDMGTGKTILSLELLRYWWDCKKLRRALIFVTSDKAFPTWEAQIKRWKIDIPYITLDASSSAAKWKILADFQEGLIIVTYPGAVAMATKLVKDNKGKNKLKLDDKLVKKLASNLDALILDESTRCGHRESLTTQLCVRLRKSAKFCYALAGRPFGRDPTLLWSQHYIVDGGQTLGETLGLFRAAFYRAEENRWKPEKVRKYAPDYVFQKRMMPQLMRIVQHRSLAYAAEECIDLPKSQNIVEEVNLPQEAGAYYKRVVDQIIAARGNLELMKSAFVRMRQLSSGFLGFRDDETGDRVEIAFAENPKLDLLLDLLSSLPDERKAVVFYSFTATGRMIFNRLKEIERKGIWLWSGTKDPKGDQRKFQTNPDYSIAIINNQVGAYSLDGLQDVANYAFFAESPISPLDREQAERRLIRQGQSRTVFLYDLLVKGTLDARIREFHSDGNDILKALRENPYLLLKSS